MEQETTHIPNQRPSFKRRIELITAAFSPAERLALYLLTLVLAASAFVLLARMNQAISTEVPTHGGSFIEGAVGTPRFISPLLAVSDVDQDLMMLTYSGLLRVGQDGNYIPDLAERYEISNDGTIYTFHLRSGLTFHDGKPLTADDVLFTIALAQNPDVKSVHRADWDGVAASAPDAHTVVFTLPHAYGPFLENTTIGILPKHLWEQVAPEEIPFSSLNTHPIGSGPYSVKRLDSDATGAPAVYTLSSFKQFALHEPYIATLTYHAFQSDDEVVAAYARGEIDSFVAASPRTLPTSMQTQLTRAPSTRVFGIFLNQNHAPVLADAYARSALSSAIDTEALTKDILGGFAIPLSGPVPPQLLVLNTSTSTSSSTPITDRAQKARDTLMRGGWKFTAASSTTGTWTKNKQSLSLTLATADTEELVATAHAVADAWNAIGVATKVDVYPLSEFNQSVLRPRAYDAILFGEVVGRSLDLFAFWHSSQRNDPGLNLSLYANARADQALSNLRAEVDATKRREALTTFLGIIAKDQPAIFLYAPDFAYVEPRGVHGIVPGPLSVPSERLADVYAWYRDTERVWNIFTK